jgi:hypothetical protein
MIFPPIENLRESGLYISFQYDFENNPQHGDASISAAFAAIYNCTRRLKMLSGLTNTSPKPEPHSQNG